MEDILGLLGQGIRSRGGLLGAFLPMSPAEKAEAERRQMAQQLQQMQMEELQRKRADADKASAAATQKAIQDVNDRERLGGIFSPYAAMGQGGPTPANLKAFQSTNSPDWRVEQYQRAANYFASIGNTAEAEKFAKLAKGVRDSQEEYGLDPKEGLSPDGKPIQYRLGKYGGNETLPTTPMPQMESVNLGDRVSFIDKLRTAPGTTMPVGVSPTAAAQMAQARAMQSQADAAREVGGGAANQKMGELVAGMRKEYNTLESVKAYKAALPILESAKNAPDTTAGDLDYIYAVGKILDPGSVVREGEMNLVIKTGSPLERFKGDVRAIMQGKGRLTPVRRAELDYMLTNRMRQLKASHDREAMPFIAQAQRMRLPADEVFGDAPQSSAGALTADEQREYEQLKKRFGLP